MPAVFHPLVKPCIFGALVGLVLAHFVSPLNAATGGVAALWLLTMRFA